MVEWLAARHWGIRAAIAITAGLATALGFQPYGWWPLVPPAIGVLTLVAFAARGFRGAAGLGFGFGVGLLLVGVGWMQVIFVQAMLGLVLMEALFYALLAAALKLAARSRWWPLLAAGAWTAAEFTFTRFPFNGFGWLRLGYAMIESPLAWLLPLVGVPGLGFATALVGNGLLWLLLAPSRRRAAVATGFAAALATLSLAGTFVPAGAASASVQVGWVQGGAPGGGVYGLGGPGTITRNHVAEAYRLAERVESGELAEPDFVVLPENTTDADPYTDAETGRLVAAMSQRLGVPLLFGVILDGPGVDERQTASLWWEPEVGETARYVKRGIVPFGEWVPMRALLLPLIPELRYVGAQSISGDEPGVLPVTTATGGAVKLGILICYDLVYDDFVHDTVRYGGQVQLVQSSNAMYQGTGQIEQQFAITRARALELRREQLVVTTSGVSGLIEADGSIAFTAAEHVGASGVVELPVRDGLTPAVLLSSWLELFLIAGTLGWLAWLTRYGRMGPKARRPGELE